MSRIYSARQILVLIYCSAFGWLGCRGDSGHEAASPASGHTLTAAEFEQNATSAVAGHAFFEGRLPEPKVWRVASSDPGCAPEGHDLIESEEIVVNTNGTLRNVFIYISSDLSSLQFPLPSGPVILDQRGCRYVPHVFGLRAGQELQIWNGDSTMHNVHAAPRRNHAFNIGMTRVVKKLARAFDRPEVMIPFNCNVHPWMSAYAGVLDHPFFAITNTEGSFRLGLLPPGEYEITAWHERFGVLKQSVKLGPTEERRVDFSFLAR